MAKKHIQCPDSMTFSLNTAHSNAVASCLGISVVHISPRSSTWWAICNLMCVLAGRWAQGLVSVSSRLFPWPNRSSDIEVVSTSTHTLGLIHQGWWTQHPWQTPRQQSSHFHPKWLSASARGDSVICKFTAGQIKMTKPLQQWYAWGTFKSRYVGAHPCFQIYREPVWHIDHLETFLYFLIKFHLPQVLNLACLGQNTKAMVEWATNTANQTFGRCGHTKHIKSAEKTRQPLKHPNMLRCCLCLW